MENKQQHFWIAQIGGWSLATFLNIVINQLLQPHPGVVPSSILAMSLGFLTTLLYRDQINRWGWKQLSPRALILPILFSVPIITTVWSVSFAIFASLFWQWLQLPRAPFFLYFLGVFVSGNLIMLIWVLSYFAYHFFAQFAQAQVEKWKLKAVVKEAQLGALKAQINPHFMFNALNNIRALILEDQGRSREMLTHLSELLRYNFSSNELQLVSLEKEMDMVQSYLELISIQYEQRLYAELNYEKELAQTLLPPMIIQLLVENAIKHGVAVLPGGGKVTINVYRQQQMIHIEVKNTGKLLKTDRLEEPSGVGLQNIRERLRLLYDERAALCIKEADAWVIATVTLPFEEPEGTV